MSCTCAYGSGVSCQFCRHRAHTNKRLEKLEAAATLLDEAHEKGRKAERAAIVADLRKQAGDLRRREGGKDLSCERLDFFANFYETGGHEGSGT